MDEAAKKKRAYTKSRLIKELAFRAGISQNQSRAALEAIIEIAYREAKANYFILPGLCKFDVVRRAPRNVRNPITGEKLVLPERDALRVLLSKRARETVVPRVAPLTEAEYAALVAQKAAEDEAARKAAEEEAARKAAEEEAARKAAEEEAARKAAEEEAARKAAEEEAARKAAEEEAAKKAAEEQVASNVAETAPAAVAASQEKPVEAQETPAEEVAKPIEEKPVEEAKPAEVAEPPVAEKPAEEQKEEPSEEHQAPQDDGFVAAPEIKGDRAISFKCTTCGQEIIAPEETAGYEAECPACGAILLVPSKSEPGTTYAEDSGADGSKKTIVSAQEIEDLDPAQLKNRTIRIDALFDDDDKAASAGDKMSNAMKSSTMRIDLPDEF